MKTREMIWTGVATLAIACGACTTVTTGTGGGVLVGSGTPDQPVMFSWNSTDDGISGSMTASISGASFQGRFFQITQRTRSELLLPLWTRWHPGWYDWPYWGGAMSMPYHATQFITRYSGKVVATLESADKQYLRCRFHLVDPVRGMAGGGEGECQLSDGRSVKANFSGQ